jgi:hypothetical protein
MINCCIHRKRQDNNLKANKNTSDHNYKILSSSTHENDTQSKVIDLKQINKKKSFFFLSVI